MTATTPQIPVWAERLQQTRAWWNRAGEVIPLEKADRQYRITILNWLQDHAERIVQTVTYYYLFLPAPRGEAAAGALEAELDAMQRDPWEWLLHTPLVRAIINEDPEIVDDMTREEFRSRVTGDMPDTGEIFLDLKRVARGRHADPDDRGDVDYRAEIIGLLAVILSNINPDPFLGRRQAEAAEILRAELDLHNGDEAAWTEALREVFG